MRQPFLTALRTLIVAAAGFGMTAAAATYEYRLDNVPADGSDCHAQAAALGARFASLTGITPTATRCTDLSAAGNDILITYQAEARLPVVSTGGTHTAAGDLGAYDDRASCEAVRSDEVSAFVQATGLEPLIGFCFKADEHRERASWGIRIDAFGASAVKPQLASSIIFDRPVTMTIPEVEESVATALRERGHNVRWVRIQSKGMMGHLTFLSYARQRPRLDTPDLARLSTREQCGAQLALARSLTYSRTEAPLEIYCGKTSLSDYTLVGVYLDWPDDATFLSAEKFAGYDACMADRERLLEIYARNSNGRVRGALCHYEVLDYGWRLQLIQP